MSRISSAPRAPLVVRDADAGPLVDLFLVCAVATILVIRAVLAWTGYPRLGSDGLHIAHMLWGGLALAMALTLLLITLSRRAKPVAAFVGGVGFGFFIDELGKFLTSDNDYFYRPTIALIYLIFVAIFLSMRRLLSRGALTTGENLANALTLVKEMALQDLDAEEKARAAAFLDRCDPRDPRVPLVRGFLDRLAPVSPPPPPWHRRLRRWFDGRVTGIVGHPRFARTLSIAFVGQALFAVLWTVLTARALWTGPPDVAGGTHIGRGFTEWARLVSTGASALIAVAGVTQLVVSRVRAYHVLRFSLFVAVFVTQFFVFYDVQLTGIVSLGFNLTMLGTVRYLLADERRREARRLAAGTRRPGPSRYS